MDRNTNCLSKRLLELSKELEMDLQLTDMNLREKGLKCPGLKSKWLLIFFEEQRFLKKLEEAEKATVQKYTEQFGDPKVPKFHVETEVRKMDDIVRLKKAIEEQKEVVRYLDSVVNKIVVNFGFDIKNCTDLIKVESM